jgi:hypothetical protein
MNEQIIKAGEGRLYGISNDQEQPGKVLKMYDGEIVLGIFDLSRAFPGEEGIDPDTLETGWNPGIILNFAFVTNLRIETDGKGLDIYWQ